MEAWLSFARGPAFRFAIVILALGLLRRVVLAVIGIRASLRMAADKSLPMPAVRKATWQWLFPTDRLLHRPGLSGFSVLFHVGVILAPLFLATHVALIEEAIGIGWPTLPAFAADVLTIAAILGLGAVLVLRASSPEGRGLSRPSDYGLLVLVGLPFLTGFLTMHPALDPFPFSATLLVHVLSADLVLAVAPFTKLVHIVLLPASQLVSEVGWHFRPDAGERVARALGKENQPV
jgi:nitrate reductase gamma subunit